MTTHSTIHPNPSRFLARLDNPVLTVLLVTGPALMLALIAQAL